MWATPTDRRRSVETAAAPRACDGEGQPLTGVLLSNAAQARYPLNSGRQIGYEKRDASVRLSVTVHGILPVVSHARQMADAVPHHLIEVIGRQAPVGLQRHLPQLRGRAMLCKKTDVVPIECVVRGYLAGSGWVDYQRTRAVCGIKLSPGLKQCDRLPEPIFTPATKAREGHDENISFEEACDRVGREVMTLLRDRSVELYDKASAYARRRGLIISDTKFEWGMRDGEYLPVDEVLTPDSSRFWPADAYEPGRDQDCFDKQYVRNYLTHGIEIVAVLIEPDNAASAAVFEKLGYQADVPVCYRRKLNRPEA